MRRGLLWLGSAGAVARVIDLVALLVVLRYVPREAIGEASVAWTFTVIFEALNGLGLGWAMVQARTLTRRQLDTIFWISTGNAVFAALLIALAAPLIAHFFGSATLAPYVAVAGVKLVAMGMMVVPYHRLSRLLKYREVSSAQVAATFLAAIVRIVLAITGAGAWAFVAAHVMHGVFLFVAIWLFAPFRPRFRFDFSTVRSMIPFGLRSSATTLVYQFYRNVDYLVVGRLLGFGALGLYRVAFDLAMEPTIAIGDVVARTTTPVLCRVANRRDELLSTFLYATRSLGLVMVPVLVLLFAAAPDLLVLVKDDSYVAAATTTRWLVVAAFIRTVYQLFPPLFQSQGRADISLRLSIELLFTLTASIAACVTLLGDEWGIAAVGLAWVLAYPPILVRAMRLSREFCDLDFLRLFGALRDPIEASIAIVVAGATARALSGGLPRLVRVSIEVAAVVAAFVLFLQLRLGVSPLAVLRRPAPKPTGEV